jgi:hypothetical protein
MTAAPGAALSHAPLPRWRTHFSGVSALQFFQSRPSESGAPFGQAAWASFHLPMHGFHEPAAGAVDIGELFLGRVTWRNLVFSDDDLARQYFQVILSKQIIKINYYGIFMDYLNSVTRYFSRGQTTLLPLLRLIRSPNGNHSKRDGGSTCHICGNTT